MASALDVLCPMHVTLDPDGRMTHAGPTLCKLRPGRPLIGQPFLDLARVLRPSPAPDMAGLLRLAGARLRLELRDPPRTTLSGVLMPDGQGGALVNLAFGISIIEAVRDYTLTNEDFAPTDLAVEMLFLVEAKSSAMEMLRQMSLRFQGERLAAEERALTDTLTGLRNRRALDAVLERIASAAQPFAVMHIDLDFFKAVNDTLGHAAGDQVLQRAAAIMSDVTRGEDTVARIGGDEFVIVLDRLNDRHRIEDIALRLIRRLEDPMSFGDRRCRISASAGTAISTDYTRPDPARMLCDADAALYAAKHAGRGRHAFHQPAQDGARLAGGAGAGP